MGSPLGPLMANALMCNIEEKLKNQNKMPAFYKRYVDDTLGMPDVSAVPGFLLTLNETPPSLSFTTELEDNGKLPFLGMVIIRNGPRLDTKVYVKPTDTGLLLHYQSHVDVKYKHSLLRQCYTVRSNSHRTGRSSIKNVNVLKWFLLACIILKPS